MDNKRDMFNISLLDGNYVNCPYLLFLKRLPVTVKVTDYCKKCVAYDIKRQVCIRLEGALKII